MDSFISIGDYVGILDGTEKGYVIKIEKGKAWIETTRGFEITSLVTKLVRYEKTKKKTVAITTGSAKKSIDKSEPFPIQKKPVIKKVKDSNFKVNPSFIGEERKHVSKKMEQNVWEVDL